MKTLLIHKKAGWMMLLASCLLFPYSCADETIVEQEQERLGDEIAFSVVDSDSWQSITTDENKSRTVSGIDNSFLGMAGNDSLFISLLVEDNDVPLSTEDEDSVSSRGASYSSENRMTSFQVKAILDNGGEFMNTTMTWDGSSSAWTYSPVKYWPQNNAVHFLGYTKSKESGTLSNISLTSTEGVGNASFSYALPVPATEGDAAWEKDALNQPDLLFAFLPSKTKQAVNAPLQFAFKHALSAVVFKKGTVPEGITIVKVEFENVYSQASCSLGEGTFTWKDWAAKKKYIQTFGEPTGDNISTTSDETCFMFIPQGFGDDAELTIHLNVVSKDPADPTGATNRTHPYSFTKKLKDFGTWEADKKYTFVISSTEEVQVEVSDRVSADGSEKDQLDIRNTGLSPAYIRVDIRGSWLLPKDPNDKDSYDRIVADWDPTKDGTFEGTENQTSTLTPGKWYKHTDGFYYYLGVVDAGQSAPKLFEKYILNTTPPVAGAELDLVIKAQAVLPEDVERVWPPEITNKLNQ